MLIWQMWAATLSGFSTPLISQPRRLVCFSTSKVEKNDNIAIVAELTDPLMLKLRRAKMRGMTSMPNERTLVAFQLDCEKVQYHYGQLRFTPRP